MSENSNQRYLKAIMGQPESSSEKRGYIALQSILPPRALASFRRNLKVVIRDRDFRYVIPLYGAVEIYYKRKYRFKACVILPNKYPLFDKIIALYLLIRNHHPRFLDKARFTDMETRNRIRQSTYLSIIENLRKQNRKERKKKTNENTSTAIANNASNGTRSGVPAGTRSDIRVGT